MSDLFLDASTKWTDGAGPESDIVIASRIRLARNIAGLPLPHRGNSESAEKIFLDCRQALLRLSQDRQYYFFSIEEMPVIDRRLLVEKRLISPLLAEGQRFSAVAVREDEGVSVMINEEDHLRIQCLLPGLQMEEAWRIASAADDVLNAQLPLAFDTEFGYLTACPTNTGTGLRASVMVHLPALEITKQLKGIFANFSRVGIAVRGMYGEGSESAGSLYQISNQISLGVSEQEIIARMQQVVRQLLDEERGARTALSEQMTTETADNVWRSYALLKYARLLPLNEMMERLSFIRLGSNLGLLTQISPRVINELMIMGQPAYLEKLSSKPLKDQAFLWERANMVRGKLPYLEQQ